ncbi:MAG: arylsulfatase [Granulicella sp.]
MPVENLPLDRRAFLRNMGSIAASATLIKPLQLLAESPRKPNIVVILADDLGYGDVSCYGATSVSTPRIDSLAKQGIRFTDAHSDAATCTPSRYAMLTGQYAWRKDGVQILPGDAKSLIEPGQTTIPSILKMAGYATGLVGKWHIGLGDGTIDWNGEIRPGPCELGFDDAFFFPATADRVPTVYIHNHRVVNLDPKDPISVSYDKKIGDEPTGKEDPDLLKMKLSEGHDGTIVDGISRIGFMTGGKKARWKDEEIAATFTDKAVQFIEHHQHQPFLLYFTPSDIHVPRDPAKPFAGKNECGVRCDVINQLDWSVGRVLDTLKRLHLDHNTLVIFTSDNGPVVNDGYDDGSDRLLGGHKPAGPYRGGKYTIFEGGTRVPFIVHWGDAIKPAVSDALIGQVDLLASLASLAGVSVPPGQAVDSINLLPALLGKSDTGRTTLVEEAVVLAIREGKWKLIDRTQRPGKHPRTGKIRNYPTEDPNHTLPHPEPPHPIAEVELYDTVTDPHEVHNVAADHPDIVERMRTTLGAIRAQGHS